MNRKGVFNLSQGPTLILTVVLTIAIGVSAFLVIDGLLSNLDYSNDPNYSAAAANGCNTTDTDSCVMSMAAANATEGLASFFSYMPTILIIAAVSILLGLIIVGFAMGRQRGYF